MDRRSFIKKSATAAMFTFLAKKTKSAIHLKPNILCILVDDLGYGDLSSFGAQDLQTPNIDNLMKAGLRFNNFYANCPVCSPTRASLLSGRYPDMVGVPGVIRTNPNQNYGYLLPKAKLLPGLLKKGGYNTALVGKWHLGLETPNTPNKRGFDYFHGFLGDMMDDYYHHRREGHNFMRMNQDEIDPKGHATDLFTTWAQDYIKKFQDKETPFFLYLAYNAPHTPIQPPQEWLDKVKKREKNIDEKRAKLVALIEHLDDSIGQVVKTLKETNQWENTLTIFVSDNGGQLNVGANNGILRSGKQHMYDGGIKVPACFVWPNKIQAESITENFGLTMDIFPTLCEIVGVPINHEIDGISLYPTLNGKDQITDNRTVFWVRREGHRYGGHDYYAARRKQWKLVQNTPWQKYELYDIQNDPKEENDLGDNHPMYKKLYDQLHNHMQKAGSIPWQKPL